MSDAKLEMQKINGRVALPISAPNAHDYGGGEARRTAISELSPV